MLKQGLAQWVFQNLSGDRDRYCTPPGAECRLDFGEGGTSDLATTYNNDGFELWLGRPDKWFTFYSARQARRLAWFILWEWWAKSTWFGLKRRLWYWSLSTRCAQQPPQEESRPDSRVGEAK